VTTAVQGLVEPVAEDMDFELVDIEYLSERGRWVLRIYLDREGGITLEDCASFSREISDLIDVKEIVPNEYVLEVSSPGLNRPLKKEKDFVRALGKKVKIKMSRKVRGRRNFTGYLREFKDHTLYVEVDNVPLSLSYQEVEKANLVYEFRDLAKHNDQNN
jgi:ribosome maturation factor RimP